jgi:hypothetical protein
MSVDCHCISIPVLRSALTEKGYAHRNWKFLIFWQAEISPVLGRCLGPVLTIVPQSVGDQSFRSCPNILWLFKFARTRREWLPTIKWTRYFSYLSLLLWKLAAMIWSWMGSSAIGVSFGKVRSNLKMRSVDLLLGFAASYSRTLEARISVEAEELVPV